MAEILFVNTTDKTGIKWEVNGTMLLATKLLQAGFETGVLRAGLIEGWEKDYGTFIPAAVRKILSFEPKCVCFYTLWPYYHVLLRLAMELKKAQSDLVIVFGGPQASFTARATMEAVPCVDYICTGEGENTIVPFMNVVLRGNGAAADVPGLYYRESGSVCFNETPVPLCDLNTLPRWDDRLLARENPEKNLTSREYFMPIDAGRGCPFGCTFCCTSRFLRRTFRMKSPERIMSDIRYFHDKFGIRSFWFTHDAFTTNHRLVNEVCDRIIESGLDITWKCTSRIDCLDEELILKMKRAGLTQIEMGVETGSERMQKLINKKLDLSRAKETVSCLMKNKIQVILFFMYGFPEETEEDLNQTLELLFDMLDLGVLHTSMSFCNFNPATAMTEKHFDDLVFDPEMKVLTRSVKFGWEEEREMILANKAMFPFFYHLNTPVRNAYQYVTFLVRLYEHFPKYIRHLRKLYKGDNLRFYRDYYETNRECFDRGIRYATDVLLNRPMEMVDAMMTRVDVPSAHVIRELMRFESDRCRVGRAKEDMSLRETYDFCYLDVHMNLPPEQFSDGKTELLMRKNAGKLEVKVLNLRFSD